MRANKELKAALLSTLRVTRQRLSQRVKKVKEKHGPMSTADATYVISHLEGLDLTKFLDAATVDRVRGLVPDGGSTASRNGSSRKRPPARLSVSIAGTVPKVDALLSTSVARDAQEMAKIYPIYYVIENSIRIVITRVLEKKYGMQWWDTRAPRPVQQRVAERKNSEAKKPWHGKRGAHEIFYSDFGDLRVIIEKNWSDFSSLFPSRQWITQRLDELEHPRNVLAHHNPVNKNDRKRVELYFHDWISLLGSKKHLL